MIVARAAGLRQAGLDFLDALDVADTLDAAELVDEAVEVADVDGFDDEVDDGASVGLGVGGGGTDVGAVVGDDGGELLEEASAVIARSARSGFERPAYWSGSTTFASARVRGIRLNAWNTNPIWRLRRSERSSSSTFRTSTPFRR